MFSRLGALIFGVIAGGVIMYASLHYHFLRAEDGWHFVPKAETTFSETYLDVRQYTASDWSKHPDVAAAVVQAEKGHLIRDAALNTVIGGVEDAIRSIRK